MLFRISLETKRHATIRACLMRSKNDRSRLNILNNRTIKRSENVECLSVRHSSCLSSQAINSFTTRPAVSVRRKLRPLYLKVSLKWFRPIK